MILLSVDVVFAQSLQKLRCEILDLNFSPQFKCDAQFAFKTWQLKIEIVNNASLNAYWIAHLQKALYQLLCFFEWAITGCHFSMQ